MGQIILASASPRRKELLEQIGLEFEICPAKGEEVISKSVPEEVVMELSEQKAKEVAGMVKSLRERTRGTDDTAGHLSDRGGYHRRMR